MMFSMFAPAFMLKLTGSIDIEFDDMDEIRDHPLAGPMLMSMG